MKTMTKKLGAIVLALAMCFSLCCTALAANSTDMEGSITITNAEKGEIYSIYKIFDLTYDETSDAYSYKVVDAWNNFISNYEYEEGKNLFTLDSNGYLDPDSAIYDQENDSAVMSAFAQAALAYAEETAIEPTGTKTADADTVEFTGLELGYYLVDTSLGTLCSLTTAVPDATAEEKNTPPDVTKEVDEKEEEAVENHKTVEYELDIDNIKGVSDLVLHDKMDMNNTQTTVTYDFDFDSVTVTLYANADDCANKENGTTLTAGTDYTVVTEGPYADGKSEDDCDFHIVFNYDFSNCTADSIIEVTIKCNLDAEGAVFGDDEFTLPNFAMVTYGNDGSSEWKEADVYEFGFKVYKYTENDDVKTALSGVTFELKNSTDEDAASAWFEVETINGQTTYLFEGWDEPEEKNGVTYTQTLTTDSNGMLYIEGVDASTYYLYETSTLDGYNPLTGPITVIITPTYDSTGKLVSHTITYIYNGETTSDVTSHQVDVENNTGSELPTTGGIGTTIFYIIGGVLVAGAVVVLVTRRRMSHEA